LNPLVQDVVEAHRTLAQDKQQNLTFTPCTQCHLAYIDYDKFERVIANLVVNAINYTPNKGTISIQTDNTDTHIQLIVTDTGQGIPTDEIPQIFNRFYRSERAKKVSGSGSGIGLAIVKGLVEAHNGTIAVKSVVDKGTTFTVMLPIVPEVSLSDI
jgi:signal transduction histidine kinase